MYVRISTSIQKFYNFSFFHIFIFCITQKIILGHVNFFYFLVYSTYKESFGIVKIINFRFLTDLHFLGMSQARFHYFYKMSVCQSACLPVCDTNFMATILAQAWMNEFA